MTKFVRKKSVDDILLLSFTHLIVFYPASNPDWVRVLQWEQTRVTQHDAILTRLLPTLNFFLYPNPSTLILPSFERLKITHAWRAADRTARKRPKPVIFSRSSRRPSSSSPSLRSKVCERIRSAEEIRIAIENLSLASGRRIDIEKEESRALPTSHFLLALVLFWHSCCCSCSRPIALCFLLRSLRRGRREGSLGFSVERQKRWRWLRWMRRFWVFAWEPRRALQGIW